MPRATDPTLQAGWRYDAVAVEACDAEVTRLRCIGLIAGYHPDTDMGFTSPLWLIGLIPWFGVALWLMWGRRRRTPVAFLDLWRGPALQPPAKRALQPPARWVAFAIVAMLLGVLAAAGPRVRAGGRGGGKPVTIFVDRGFTMSAMLRGKPRFVRAAEEAGPKLLDGLNGSAHVELILLPDDALRQSSIDDWASAVEHAPITAVDTRAQLRETVRNRLAAGVESIVVVSDQVLDVDDPRLIQFSPESAAENVGIVVLAARETPTPQVMVRVRNDSRRASAGVTLTSGDARVHQAIDLPPAGQTRDVFVDVQHLGAVVEAALDGSDDQPADDRAWLVREGSLPRLEPHAALPAEVRRIVDVYAHARPATEASSVLPIVGAPSDLPADGPGVVVATVSGDTASGAVSAADHPMTADVDWTSLARGAQVAADPPKGWMQLVSVGGRVVVATRTEPARAVWVGFESPPFAATPDFVVFWANAFTWAGQGQERFAGYPLSQWEPGWTRVPDGSATSSPSTAPDGTWPGVYRSSEGAQRAFNARSDMPPGTARTTADWRARLSASASAAGGTRDLAPWLLLGALACLAAAAFAWPRRNLTPVSAARTF